MIWFKRERRFVRPEEGELCFFAEAKFERALRELPSSRQLDHLKKTLQAGDDHLFNRFREGENVSRLTRDRARFLDRLIYHSWNLFKWDDDIALVAVGGYGRMDMHPQSDIDLLFLTHKDNHHKYRDSILKLTTLLWDIGLKVGHSVRTARQCASTAQGDLTVMTNLIESRTIVGDEQLRLDLNELIAPNRIWSEQDFYRGKAEEQRQRHEKHGIVEYDMEPNVKESPGALRDIQNINWIARRIYGVAGLEQLAGRKVYTEEEYTTLAAAQSFLARVRFALHMITGKPIDQLQFDYQRQLSELLGYEDTPERLAVEVFMRDYYRSVTAIRVISDVLMQVLGDHLTKDTDSGDIKIVNDRFQIRDDLLEARRAQVFEETPSALLEIFVLLSRDKKIRGIQAGTIRLLREYASIIDGNYRRQPEHRELFVKLLESQDHLSVPLQMMARYGILGRYLPEFGDIQGLPQHDLFHIYPVDVHTLNVVRNIRHFGLAEGAAQSPISAYIYSTLRKPELLIVAGLYHDIAKGRGGDHSELGAIDVIRFAEEHGYNRRETRLMAWLVENHLLMSRISQREDISDPAVVQRFARFVGDETHLNHLYALTVADITATNPTLWSNWRASLMRQLYMETRKALRSGLEDLADRSELIKETRDTAMQILESKGIPAENIDAIWSSYSDEYFLKETPEDIAWHTEIAHRQQNVDEPVVIIRPYIANRRERATQILVRMGHAPNLFAAVATSIDEAGLNIQDARIYENHEATLSCFYILDEHASPLGKDSNRVERLAKAIRDELTNVEEHHQVAGARTKRALKQFPVRTTATLSDGPRYSMLEVTTADRPGLLAVIGQIFVKYDLRLHSARITTLGERVEDIFMISDARGHRIQETALKDELTRAVCETIDQKVDAIAS